MHPAVLRGARTHNLQGVDLELEPGQVVAITGVSGAGKSSLAIDTLYAEGQRRFVESFTPYARQFLERLERPPMDGLDPVPAGICVDRRAPVKSSRSTVATMADIEPYLSALFVREAVPVCPEHQEEAVALDPETASREVVAAHAGERIVVGYPLRISAVEPYLEVREQLARGGYRRLWVDGEVLDIDAAKPSQVLGAPSAVDVIVDRVRARASDAERIATGIETAWRLGSVARVHSTQAERTTVWRRGLACRKCGRDFEPPRPGLFSYESPLGACPACRGFGRVLGIDLEKVIPDPSRSLKNRAIRPWSTPKTKWERGELYKLCRRHGIPTDVSWNRLSAEHQRLVIDGDGTWEKGFPGVRGWFRWLEGKTYKMHVRVFLARYRSYDECGECGGSRLNAGALTYCVGGIDLAAWHRLEIRDALARLDQLAVGSGQGDLARRELVARLRYLDRVGLGYLTLDRQARTLSGGEGQRVTLTAALGTSLHNALFVLDEPTVGLHPTDVLSLNSVVRELAERGNTVLLVEHDPLLIRAADRVVELGPGAGAEGGRIVADGTPRALARGAGATARALAEPRPAASPRRAPRGELVVRGARANNLRGDDATIPLGVVCAVTGPSGSGKSTLVVQVLYRALARRLGDFDVDAPGTHERIEGADLIREVTLVDQAPLGRTSRGNAATYTKAWDSIRKRFAAEPGASAARLTPSHFSFNVEGGRCDACAGEGFETVEMQFLADVRLVCPACRGRRFQPAVLAVRHRGLSIADLLELTVDEVLERFRDDAQILRSLTPLQRLGLGYVRLGQPLSTLSGGEAQRFKLARALTGKHRDGLVVLDEPSAGLHADEVAKLRQALDIIVESGGSVIVVEHDLDVIRGADWVVDLGPGAGREGGSVVGCGPPEQIAQLETRTGSALRGFDEPAPGTKRRPRERPRPTLAVECAREHNLREVSTRIPHGALTVVTGPSGSGKSTLAFDVVFAEGQRRFLETLTPYARQFLPTLPRPDVDSVTGVPPSVALEQRTARAGPRSTVATVTEIAHYLRLLFAKLGVPHCPVHDEPIEGRSAEDAFAAVCATRGRAELLAPAVQARKGVYLDLFTAAARAGIPTAWCDGVRVFTDTPPRLARTREHTIDLVITAATQLAKLSREDFDRALQWGNGTVKLRFENGREQLLSTTRACPECGLAVPELDPRHFSFNTEQGRCGTCEGTGVLVAEQQVGRGRKREKRVQRTTCPSCEGTRLAPLPRAVRLQGARFAATCAHDAETLLKTLRRWRFTGRAGPIAQPIVGELRRRLSFMCDVGLGYLALDRAAGTLSGGEMQRLRLAAQLGAGLTGALYVLDEPTIGLHPRDTGRLLRNLRRLVDLGSTVLVVEHDADTIRAADHLVDLGPAGGHEGGQVVAEGPVAAVLRDPRSPTGRVLQRQPELRAGLPVKSATPRLLLEGASEHNLREVRLEVPTGRFTVVAGVSGSGKSTLVRHVLLPAVRRELGLSSEVPGAFRALGGLGTLRRALAVDQSPIGRTPRSVPATYLGIWDAIRRLFAATPEAQVAGFAAARFSFNTGAGRCLACEGQGAITHEMSFLPDVTTVCPTCEGRRFEPRTLAVSYRGHSIGDVLALTAGEAAELFANHPKIAAPLRTLVDLGAGYITLGQGSHTLSGGEAQRLKLASEVTASARHEPTLYVLDEPTTGLHLSDIYRLMGVLDRLVERGDTLVVIEHHPVVMAGADWLVELGPEGGQRGGKVVAKGTPRQVAEKKTPTAAVLRELLS